MTTHATRSWYALPTSFQAIARTSQGAYAQYTVIAFAFERDEVLWLTMEGEVISPTGSEARVVEGLDKSVWNGT